MKPLSFLWKNEIAHCVREAKGVSGGFFTLFFFLIMIDRFYYNERVSASSPMVEILSRAGLTHIGQEHICHRDRPLELMVIANYW
jgi:hypothetical protein